MEKKKKWGGFLRVIFGRTTFVVLFLLIQIAVLLAAFQWLGDYMSYIFGGFTLISAIVVIHILNRRQNPCYQLAWIIPVLVIPVFGAMFYLFVELELGTRLIKKKLVKLIDETDPYLKQDQKVMEDLSKESVRVAHLASYMKNYGGFPIHDKTHVEYFSLGDTMYPKLLEEMKKAKRYIFMEYFILEEGVMWDGILEVLKQKAAEGVEIRVMYDGFCTLNLLPYHYPKELEQFGIKCKMFSPIKPALSTYQNNRDHRKITVIDGHTAFTGGVNLADEYINQRERFGHWKDTALMLKGKAVDSFLMMFLQMWNVFDTGTESYAEYLKSPDYYYEPNLNMDGYVMPYGDSPFDDETVGQHMYMDMLNEARQYVHIMTPYLILDSDMLTALTFAAKRGVETIIIMPHIPDKLYAYLLARSHYEELLMAGVKIYEYTPGFVHAKSFSSDDEKAIVGTINLDYRSLYLHFECAAFMFRNKAVHKVEQDFQETLRQSQEITLEGCRQYPLWKRWTGKALRLFAPLM